MAVIQEQGGGGLLGGLGAIATLGGVLTGNPFLSSLGTGLGTANNILNGGNGQGGIQGGTSWSDILNNILGGLIKPTDNNIAKVAPKGFNGKNGSHGMLGGYY